MGALRNLGGTFEMIGKQINRLSTGLRINSAGDDPAGLIISENMRSQLKGLDSAIRNSQDAVNMAKTAEAALDEVQSLLKQVRGIAVHSANSAVIDSAQLQANQSQVRSILQSIDRIATGTQWGQKKLLDGTAGITSAITAPSLVASMYIGGTFNGFTTASGNVTVTRTTQATAAALNGNTTYAATTSLVPAGTVVLNGFSVTSTGTDSVTSFANKINELSSQTGVVASVIPSAGNQIIRLSQTTEGAQYKINLTDPGQIINNAAAALAGTDGAYAVTAPTLQNGVVTNSTATFTGGRGPGDSGLKLTDTYGNLLMVTPGGNAGTWNANTLVGTVTSGAVQFQVGANANQSVMFAMPKTFASDLGVGAVSGQTLATLDVTTTTGANNAMAIADAAITQLAQLRGNLGSFQANYLESNVRSLGVARENLTAAESQIRDADMAVEMTRYTQLQILQQSGMSMLSQANQQPQSILQLLRGQ